MHSRPGFFFSRLKVKLDSVGRVIYFTFLQTTLARNFMTLRGG